jgi:hypothetical protein
MRQFASPQDDDDVVVIDRRRESRIIVSVPGQYVFPNRLTARTDLQQFDCRVVNISSHAVTLVAATHGPAGELVVVYCDEFGTLKGSIVRLYDSGFTISIDATDEERALLGAKIEWYDKNKNHDVSDKRKHKRFVPKDPRSILICADGRLLGCSVIDMSISGAAVFADIYPAIGTPIAVGTVVGRVIRHRPDGFAVRFIEIQDAKLLEQKVMQRGIDLHEGKKSPAILAAYGEVAKLVADQR